MNTIHQIPKTYPIYHSAFIKAWEGRWFLQGNSSFGLMSQAALVMANHIENILVASDDGYLSSVLVWCGVGNNGGDGYLIAHYLHDKGFDVSIFAPSAPATPDCIKAYDVVCRDDVRIIGQFDNRRYDVHIDALFGNGLDRQLSQEYQALIATFNQQDGVKFAVDIPSGLHPDTGMGLPLATKVDYSLCVLGLKIGLLTGQGRHYTGQVIEIGLIPTDDELVALGEIATYHPQMTWRNRHDYAHKGDFGHVLIIGGCANMGGAVIMAGEAAMACGAGKVTIMCDKSHHGAILARSPNIMVKDIQDVFDAKFGEYLQMIDGIAFGMGLGRDSHAQDIYQAVMAHLSERTASHRLDTWVVMDADALYFLAKNPIKLHHRTICTPHSAEAGRLLNLDYHDIDNDRVQAVTRLFTTYHGNWVLKGAGSLTLECDDNLVNVNDNGNDDKSNPNQKPTNPYKLDVCAFGNAGMATAGMGDVLSGMIIGLMVQNVGLRVANCVSLHALAGDCLASDSTIGINAHDMKNAIKMVMNGFFHHKP